MQEDNRSENRSFDKRRSSSEALREELQKKDKIISEISTDLGILNLQNQKLEIELQQKNLENKKQKREIESLKEQLKMLKPNKKKKKGKFDIIKARYPMEKYSYLHKDKFL
jgi:chromosome segregation ATPase